jgi:CBS domain-containing protein
MNTTAWRVDSKPLFLDAETAVDLMTANPLSIRAAATLREAVAFLIDKGISGAPVIDSGGRPIGVLTQTDLLIHDRETVHYLTPAGADIEADTLLHQGLREGFQIEEVDRTSVREVMTPVVFKVAPETPAGRVIEEILTRKIHRLFVVDANGVLVGVISSLDILRRLRSSKPPLT